MSPDAPVNGAVDFDLHGLAGVRLLGARQGDVAAVMRQLGPIRVPSHQEPPREAEIVVRFVDEEEWGQMSETRGPVDHVALGRTAYGAGDGARRFFVLQGKGKTPAKVQLPLDCVGERCEIVCQHGVAAVPYLIPILNLTVLANGALPLHAGAFVYEGQGVLVTGWSKGGKTEALLGFMARGATYVADEWTYLFDGGRCMAGIPEPVRVWEWHLRQAPVYRRRLARKQRLQLATLGLLQRGLDWLAPEDGRGWRRNVHRLQALVKKQQGVNVAPRRLFGTERWAARAAVDRVFFVVSSDIPGIRVEAVDPLLVARRMVHSLQEEQRHLLSLYRQYRFAFPAAQNLWIERSQELQAARLQEMLAGKETYVVRHPYPVPIEEMATAMERVLR